MVMKGMRMMEEPVYKVDEWGNKFWLLNDRLNKIDGPAAIWANGSRLWYVNGLRHRTDGPAVIWADETQEWWVNHKDITKEVEKWMKDQAVSWPWPDEETRVEFLLTWMS